MSFQAVDDIIRESRMIAAVTSEGAGMAKSEEGVSAEDMKAARTIAGMTQEQAAMLVGTSVRNWQNWEQGYNTAAHAVYELFLLKTGQFTLRDVVVHADSVTLRLRLRTGYVVEMEVKPTVYRELREDRGPSKLLEKAT